MESSRRPPPALPTKLSPPSPSLIPSSSPLPYPIRSQITQINCPASTSIINLTTSTDCAYLAGDHINMEFPDLGRHCSEETCHQLDFLPFKCDGCKKVFCLEHRTYKGHSCPNENHKDVSVLICSLCERSVRTVFGESSEMTIKRHSQSGSCNPNQIVKKPKCPVRGCRELLTFSNKYACDSCRKAVCLRHRFPADHACGAVAVGKPKEAARTTAAAKFLASFGARQGTDCGSESARMGALSISDKKIEQEKTPTIRP